MRQLITLIGCGKAKQPSAAWVGCAQDLYTGCLFRARKHFAERSGDRWAIVSAKHGLVMPKQLLSPYDTTIKDLTKMERTRWALDIAGKMLGMSIQAKPLDPKNVTIALHMGRDYAELIIPVLEAVGFSTRWATQGMSQGEQLQWYSRMREDLTT